MDAQTAGGEAAESAGGPSSAIVVGAGITGVAAAEWLRRDGWRVTLIDRAPPGDPAAASFGNGGLLARAAVVPVPVPGLLRKAPGMLLDPDGPLFLRWSQLPRIAPFLARHLRHGGEREVRRIAGALSGLVHDSVQQHQRLAAGAGAEGYIRTGDYGFLYRDRAAYDADAFGHALRREHGFEPRLIGRREIEDIDPALAPEWRFAALFPDHGWIEDPGGYVAALSEHFVREGGRLRRGEIVDLTPEGKVTLEGGATMRADRVILAAGAWSRALAARLGLKLPMETERGYHLMLHGASSRPALPWMVTAAKAAATPMRDGLRMAGIVEFGGLKPGPSKAPQALLRRLAPRIWPGLEWERETLWMGHRPTLPDSLPALGPVPGAPNVIMATGAQHVGLTIGPRLGRMAARLAAGQGVNEDLAPFAPGRFGRR